MNFADCGAGRPSLERPELNLADFACASQLLCAAVAGAINHFPVSNIDTPVSETSAVYYQDLTAVTVLAHVVQVEIHLELWMNFSSE
jgi:hypothetical protein